MGVSEILLPVDREIEQLQRARALLAGRTVIKPKKRRGRPRKNAASSAPVVAEPAKKKRNLSPEGRKRIAEAVKLRWAAQKKAAAAKKA